MTDKAAAGTQTRPYERPLEREKEAARAISRSLLAHLPDLVESCDATALFIYVDAVDEQVDVSLPALSARVFHVTKAPMRTAEGESQGIEYLRVPNVPLTRIGQVKIAVFLALSKGLIRQGDRVVFLTGLAAAKTLDTIVVTEVGSEYEIFAPGADLTASSCEVLPEVVERVVDIACELGSEGREGRVLGTMFVVGDANRVMPLTRQLVLNPFKGYPPGERNILDYSLEETVKELATLDGAFIIRGDGVMETCGAYIRTASQEEFELPRGLGARHHAAAAITAVTDSIAVTVSESTGSITIFRGGRILTEIQKPRSVAEKPRLHRVNRQRMNRRNNKTP
jgi:diadenylate cyclase